MNKCVVPGTFDPITKGHLDIIKRASKIFDKVIVAVAVSVRKNPMHSIEQRCQLAIDACHDIDNVEVKSFDCLLVDFVKAEGAKCVVKGIRDAKDYEYEANMAAINKRLSEDIETVFLFSDPANINISSSQVRELESLGVDCSELLP